MPDHAREHILLGEVLGADGDRPPRSAARPDRREREHDSGREEPGPRPYPSAPPHGDAALDQPEQRIRDERSEEHTSELQSLMRISYAVFCLKNKKTNHN